MSVKPSYFCLFLGDAIKETGIGNKVPKEKQFKTSVFMCKYNIGSSLELGAFFFLIKWFTGLFQPACSGEKKRLCKKTKLKMGEKDHPSKEKRELLPQGCFNRTSHCTSFSTSAHRSGQADSSTHYVNESRRKKPLNELPLKAISERLPAGKRLGVYVLRKSFHQRYAPMLMSK